MEREEGHRSQEPYLVRLGGQFEVESPVQQVKWEFAGRENIQALRALQFCSL